MSYHQALHRNLVYLAQLADSTQNIAQILPPPHILQSNAGQQMPPGMHGNVASPPSSHMPPHHPGETGPPSAQPPPISNYNHQTQPQQPGSQAAPPQPGNYYD